YLAVAAGLLVGAGGAAFLAGLIGLAAIGVAVARRSGSMVAVIVLFWCGLASGALMRREDARCAETIERGRAATVRLSEPLVRGRSARGTTEQGTCRLRVRVRSASATAPAGALVRVVGDARRQGRSVVFREAGAAQVEGPGILARWRTRAGEVIDTLYGRHAPLARALLIADERDIAQDVRQQFADAGIIHMLSVSGLHVAVLAEAVVLTLMVARVSVRRAELLAVAIVAAFVLFVGAPAPAVRSGAMFAALVVARRLQRPTSAWALLALGGWFPLVEPRVAREIGYQLSVVGMAGLLASGMLARRLAVLSAPTIPARLGREMLATIVASAVTTPIVAWHFGRVSLAAPITNLAAAPLFALAQPALFLSMLLAPIEPAARLVADGTGVLLAGIELVGRLGATLPGAAIDVMPSAPTALAAAAAAAALVAACASPYWERPVAIALAALASAVWWPLLRPQRAWMEVHVLDVGQGDAIALRTPKWRWIVIDAGNAWRTGDDGERLIVPYLRRRGGDVALLVLSHPHADHVGGAATLVRRMRVGAVLDGAYVLAGDAYAAAMARTRARGVPWRAARAGDTLMVDGVRLVVLAPDSASLAQADDANAASVVLAAEFRGVRVLLTGDAEREQEDRLRAQYGPALRADILKVGHHGSSTSSTEEFLEAVRPRVALVSVGADNRYGHPNPDVLARLRARGAEVLRTDEDGTVVVATNGETIRVSTEDARWDVPVLRVRR
ncbi:MAG TPA: DNA internalization-related competence protein ComEC/Rec2, partial [Gemmatimonadaceae bacterium]